MKKLFFLFIFFSLMSSCIVVLPNKHLRTEIRLDKRQHKSSCSIAPYPQKKKFNKYKAWRRMYR